MDQAFTLLRDQARARDLRLSDLAQAFIDGAGTLTGPAPGKTRRAAWRRAGPQPAPAGPAARAVDSGSAPLHAAASTGGHQAPRAG